MNRRCLYHRFHAPRGITTKGLQIFSSGDGSNRQRAIHMKNTYFKLLTALMLTLGVVAASMGTALAASSESYIVIMANDPAISYEGDLAGLAATKPGKGGKINPNSAHVRKYQKFLRASQDESLASASVDQSARVHSYTIAISGYSAFLTEEQARAIKAQAGVLKVMKDVMRYPDTDASGEFLGLTDEGGAYMKGYTGEGVVVGVIDSGIWPEHPSFADDGSYAAPPITLDDSRPNCEFGNTAHNPSDAPFTCNNKLIGVRQMLDTYRPMLQKNLKGGTGHPQPTRVKRGCLLLGLGA